MNKMTYSQKYELIRNMISPEDYKRAEFIFYNDIQPIRVRKNIFSFYDHAEIKKCARHILNNYDRCEYTFDMMSAVADDKFIARMLRESVPYWKRVINAYMRAYNKHSLQR